MHTAIFKQMIVTRVYYVNKFYDKVSYNDHYRGDNLCDLIVIELEEPILEAGQDFFINDMNKIVTVTKSVRTSKTGERLYLTDEKKLEIDADSKIKAEKEFKEYMESKPFWKKIFNRSK